MDASIGGVRIDFGGKLAFAQELEGISSAATA